MRARTFASVLCVAAAGLAARTAHAACQRPTDPGGVNGYDYGADPVSHFDGKSVRVWYTTTGMHAVDPTTTRVDQVPDNVATAASVADAAFASYVQMGFTAPLSDSGSGNACGGSPALDLYLMHFNAADGDTATETCTASGKATQCTTFLQVESHLEKIYGSFELGAHVVIAHEIFHSVQDAYDQKLDHFWAEGTAQWAAKTLYPAETDLESFLPAFFSDAGKSIDIAGGGVVSGFLYGAAIWPVFLDQYLDPDTIRASLEQEATLGPPSMNAIDAALPTFGSSLADAYPTFAAWNAATGSRAGTGGYADAASYPEVTLTPMDDSGVSDIATGFSVFFYSYDFGDAQEQLTLTGDETRVAARTFPLEGGKARLDELSHLPATVTGAGVVVVAGISSKKSDAPFSIQVAAPPSGAGTGGGGGGGGGGGCAVETGSAGGGGWGAALALFAGLAVASRRRTRRDR